MLFIQFFTEFQAGISHFYSKIFAFSTDKTAKKWYNRYRIHAGKTNREGGVKKAVYVHIGQDYMVPLRQIVCIFDMDTATASARTRRLLTRLGDEGRIVDLCDDLPGSAVLCTGELGEILYLSPISSRTLQKRVEEGTL